MQVDAQYLHAGFPGLRIPYADTKHAGSGKAQQRRHLRAKQLLAVQHGEQQFAAGDNIQGMILARLQPYFGGSQRKALLAGKTLAVPYLDVVHKVFLVVIQIATLFLFPQPDIAAGVKALGASRFAMKVSTGPLSHELISSSIELYGSRVGPLVRDMLA